jgi:hypothetical protein
MIFVMGVTIRLYEQKKVHHRFDDAKTIDGPHGHHYFTLY